MSSKATPEKQTCPLRKTHGLAGRHDLVGEDLWEADRWSRERPDDTSSTWQWSWEPRSCSFCGSVHPEDVIRLLHEGWEDEIADGRRKGYLSPPGSIDQFNAFTNLVEKGVSPLEAMERAPSIWKPVPPAKFYTSHFSPAQFEELDAVRSRRLPDYFKKRLKGRGDCGGAS